MMIITIRNEQAGYVAHTHDGNIAGRGRRLADIKLVLVPVVDGIHGKIIYQRPSQPGITSPVTLFDCRPRMNFRGGAWAN